MSGLHGKLARLARTRSVAPPRRGAVSPAESLLVADLEETLTGRRIGAASGTVFVHTAWLDGHRGHAVVRAKLDALPQRLDDAGDELDGGAYGAVRAAGLDAVVFVDLETGGLFGQPIFLAGVLCLQGGKFVVHQACVQEYAEEEALLAWMAERLARAAVVVSYNGKSYDLPMLRDRGTYHGLSCDYGGPHIDVLHLARRRYRHRLPNCRLTTLERHVYGRHRSGDVPGALVPGRFHRFLQDRDPGHVIPVLHHNVLDLVTLAELFCDLAPESTGPRFEPSDDFFVDHHTDW